MPIEIIQPRERREEITYDLFFEYTDERGAGFSFPCDANGVVNEAELHENALQNLAMCREIAGTNINVSWGNYGVCLPEVRQHVYRYTVPAIGLCLCGANVYLDGFTNTCEVCERDYNLDGQLLASRSQWGEETGESLGDILCGVG